VRKTQRDKRYCAIKECRWLAWQIKRFFEAKWRKGFWERRGGWAGLYSRTKPSSGLSGHSAITLEGRFTAGVEDGEGK